MSSLYGTWKPDRSTKLSVWETPPSSRIDIKIHRISGEKDETNERKKRITGKEAFFCCVTIGGLIAGIALAVVITFYLIHQSTSSVPTVTDTCTIESIYKTFWTFNNNTLDLYGGFDGNVSGSPTYNTSFLGYGAAISLTRALNQFVSISPKAICMKFRSFTIEAWIYPIGSSGVEYGIFGQCQSTMLNLCLHFSLRNNTLYCGFFNNDVSGVTTIVGNRWSHVACVYDATTQLQQVWLNGVLDGSRSATSYQGVYGITTIGATFSSGIATSFNGYIDQVRFESRAKNATELLNDATLYVHYSFDSGSLFDDGPNGINGTASGSPTSTLGRVSGGIEFNSGSYMYYTYAPYYFLGISNQAFSISLWAKPTGNYSNSTLVFVERSVGWCLHFIAMTRSGFINAYLWNGGLVGAMGPMIPLNSWTHIGYTYSFINGLCLYVNGTLYTRVPSFTFAASGVPMRMILGSDGGKTYCSPSYGGPFTGALDEFYVHRRELTASEVQVLANP